MGNTEAVKPIWVTSKYVKQHYHLSRYTLNGLVDQGEVRAKKLGGEVRSTRRYYLADLEAFFAAPDQA